MNHQSSYLKTSRHQVGSGAAGAIGAKGAIDTKGTYGSNNTKGININKSPSRPKSASYEDSAIVVKDFLQYAHTRTIWKSPLSSIVVGVCQQKEISSRSIVTYANLDDPYKTNQVSTPPKQNFNLQGRQLTRFIINLNLNHQADGWVHLQEEEEEEEDLEDPDPINFHWFDNTIVVWLPNRRELVNTDPSNCSLTTWSTDQGTTFGVKALLLLSCHPRPTKTSNFTKIDQDFNLDIIKASIQFKIHQDFNLTKKYKTKISILHHLYTWLKFLQGLTTFSTMDLCI